MSASRHQTLNHLRELFERRGLCARSELGQNFLIDLNLQDVLVRSAQLEPTDVVLEVGAGTGGLTRRLAAAAAWVVAVEVDRGFYELASDHVADLPNVTLLHMDALATKNRLAPAMMETLADRMRRQGVDRFKLVANLPYCIATPLLLNLLTEAPLASATITLQREVADRLDAPPGTPAYNALTVLVQALADVQRLRHLGPSVFWPRPRVSSAMVRVVPSAAKRAAVGDVEALQRCTRLLFQQRRKHIHRVLRNCYQDRATAHELLVLLEGLAIDPGLRAEALAPDRIVALAKALATRFPETGA